MMMLTLPTTLRPTLPRAAFSILAIGFAFALSAAPSLRAAEEQKMEKAATLPLKASFEKVKQAESGPFILHLKNESKSPIKAKAKILLAVAFHADSKARLVPEETIGAGKTWSIPGLVADDKVTITADGYEPLQITVH